MARTDQPYRQQTSTRARQLLDETFLNEEHIEAFQAALELNDLIPDPSPESNLNPFTSTPTPTPTLTHPSSPGPSQTPTTSAFSFPTTLRSRTRQSSSNSLLRNPREEGARKRRESMASLGGWERVESIKSLSDFAPVHQKVSRRRKNAGTKIGFSYHLFRWPLLGLMFLFIYLEFGLYVILRQIVWGIEWTLASIGKRNIRHLLARLRSSSSYTQWLLAARELDKTIGFEEWKSQDEDPKYDYPLIRKVRKSLKVLREAGDGMGLIGVLEICLRNNFAGVEGVRMYSETFLGTKNLIESYVNEMKRSLDHVREDKSIPLEEKRRFYRAVNKNYGASALCLSGGAGFGYYHFGVVKAFLEADLLPKVVTGTSAGGLVAALTCTRTDEELRELLVPELADRITACEDGIMTWSRRFWKTGARFSAVEWAKKATFFTHGSMTFREAYERTGRALNVSVIPHDQHSPTKLLNHLTAPDCVIWSAIIASAAVPGILPGVVLMQKTPTGDLRPMNFGSKFKDGSLRVDIPLESLHLLFNVNYAIVSQANPHVHLFFFGSRGSVGSPVAHRKGKGWRGGFLLSAAEQYLKLELTKNFKVIRDLELMPQLLGSDWSSVFLQRFAGSVTILPKSRIIDWFRLLNDPDRKELERMMRVGQQVAWPTLHMVENRLKVERSILKGRSETRQASLKSSRPPQTLQTEEPSQLSDPNDSSPATQPMELRETDGESVASSSSSGSVQMVGSATDGMAKPSGMNGSNGMNGGKNLPNLNRSVREPARRNPKALYGILAVFTTYLLFGIYVLWAFLPWEWTCFIGLGWLPDRSWTVIVPAYLIVVVVLTYIGYAALMLYHSPGHGDLDLLGDTRGQTSQDSQKHSRLRSEGKDDPSDLSDIPLSRMNRRLFPARPRPTTVPVSNETNGEVVGYDI